MNYLGYRLIYAAVFIFCTTICTAQNSKIEVEEISNEELLYVLTYLEPENFQSAKDDKNHYFIKLYKLRDEEKFLIDLEEQQNKSFYYFLISSFDESSHLEAKLYRTTNLLQPRIESVTESEDQKYFNILISYVDEPEKKNSSAGN